MLKAELALIQLSFVDIKLHRITLLLLFRLPFHTRWVADNQYLHVTTSTY